jgi:hypothetical protein
LAWIVTPSEEVLRLLAEVINDYLGLESIGLDWTRRSLARMSIGQPALVVVDAQEAPVAVRNELVRRLGQHRLRATPIVVCGTGIAALGTPWDDLLAGSNVGVVHRPFAARALVDEVLRLRGHITSAPDEVATG